MRLAVLRRDEREEPCAAPAAGGSGADSIEAVVGSGAEESVAPPGLFVEKATPSPMSREGRCYRAANGSPIPNLGQILAHLRDAEGRPCGSPFQVVSVERPLLSVYRMAAVGLQCVIPGGPVGTGNRGRVGVCRRWRLFSQAGAADTEVTVAGL